MTIDRITADLVDPEIAAVLNTFPPLVLSEETLPVVRSQMANAGPVESSDIVEARSDRAHCGAPPK